MWIENNEDNRYHSKEGMKYVSDTWHKGGEFKVKYLKLKAYYLR